MTHSMIRRGMDKIRYPMTQIHTKIKRTIRTSQKITYKFFYNKKIPDELFRAAHLHNSAQFEYRRALPCFHSHIGAGHESIKPLMCKHNVVYVFMTLVSFTLYRNV